MSQNDLKYLCNAYKELLKINNNSIRINLQNTLCILRDAIADRQQLFSETVQLEFEQVALREKKEPVLADYPNVRFMPTNCFAPNHTFVKSNCFPFDTNNEGEKRKAATEANLADAIARVAFDNGMSATDVNYLLPAILRMLNSKSENTK